jgi:hypothetical protein
VLNLKELYRGIIEKSIVSGDFFRKKLAEGKKITRFLRIYGFLLRREVKPIIFGLGGTPFN